MKTIDEKKRAEKILTKNGYFTENNLCGVNRNSEHFKEAIRAMLEFASAQSGWTDEDMRKAFEAGTKIDSDYPFWGNDFNRFIQSLPKNPSSSEREGMFAEFTSDNNWERVIDKYHNHYGKWVFDSADPSKRKYLTTTELLNSEEYQKWKEGRK